MIQSSGVFSLVAFLTVSAPSTTRLDATLWPILRKNLAATILDTRITRPMSPGVPLCRSGRLRLFRIFVRQPRRDHRGHEAGEAVEDELHHAALRAAQATQQFARYEPGRAHDQHPHERTYLRDVDQNVIDRPEHQRRHDA